MSRIDEELSRLKRESQMRKRAASEQAARSKSVSKAERAWVSGLLRDAQDAVFGYMRESESFCNIVRQLVDQHGDHGEVVICRCQKGYRAFAVLITLDGVLKVCRLDPYVENRPEKWSETDLSESEKTQVTLNIKFFLHQLTNPEFAAQHIYGLSERYRPSKEGYDEYAHDWALSLEK